MERDNYPEAKIRSAVRMVMDLLVRREYAALAALTVPPGRLQGSEIKRAIEAYPGSVRMLNDWELRFNVVPIYGPTPSQYSVDAPVFTVEECPSDLTARMTVIDGPGEQFDVVLYDIWVM